jgi:tRNA dimethylallyltransferase
VREEILDRARASGWPALHAELRDLDPASGERLHPNDGARILRALEVVAQSGIPMSEWHRRHALRPARYPAKMIAVQRPSRELQKRIDDRVDRMMDRGFLGEVERLLSRGFSPASKPLQGLGYRRLCAHLAGEASVAESIAQIKTDTRRLAKRQRTWFNGERDLVWMPPSPVQITEAARTFFESTEAKR